MITQDELQDKLRIQVYGVPIIRPSNFIRNNEPPKLENGFDEFLEYSRYEYSFKTRIFCVIFYPIRITNSRITSTCSAICHLFSLS